MSKNALDRSVLDIIGDPECGTPDDKLRLFLVYYICSPNMTEVIPRNILTVPFEHSLLHPDLQSETDQYAAALQAAGCNLAALRFLKRWKLVILNSNFIILRPCRITDFFQVLQQDRNWFKPILGRRD